MSLFISIRDSFISLCILGGISACVIYKDSPDIVGLAASVAFMAWVVEKALTRYTNSYFSKLRSAEAVDLSFLRQLRRIVKDGKPVSEEHISVSEKASNDADAEYKKVFGFGRPLPAVASGTATNLQQN